MTLPEARKRWGRLINRGGGLLLRGGFNKTVDARATVDNLWIPSFTRIDHFPLDIALFLSPCSDSVSTIANTMSPLPYHGIPAATAHEHGGFWACPCQLCKEENLGEEVYPVLSDDEPVTYVRKTD